MLKNGKWFFCHSVSSYMHLKQDNRSNVHSFAMVIMGGEKSAHAIRCFFVIVCSPFIFVIFAKSKLNMCDLCLQFVSGSG